MTVILLLICQKCVHAHTDTHTPTDACRNTLTHSINTYAHTLTFIYTKLNWKSVKSQLANFKETAINKLIAFKETFSSLLFLLFFFLVIPTTLSVHIGKQDFLLYRKGFISATWSQARGGISSAIQAIRGRPDHVIYYTSTQLHTHFEQLLRARADMASEVLTRSLASSSQFTMSPEHDDKLLAIVSPTLSGAQEKQPLEQSPSQTNRGLHKASHKPQPTSQFPLCVFFSPSNTHKHIYMQTKAQGGTSHTKFQEIDSFYHFIQLRHGSWWTSFLSADAKVRPACLPACFASPVRVSCSRGGRTR